MRYVVERDYLANNIEIVKREMGGVPVIGTVKANGYGWALCSLRASLLTMGLLCLPPPAQRKPPLCAMRALIARSCCSACGRRK